MHDPLPPPLIVTLTLDAAAQAWFDTCRTTHFPPERLAVGAHVTMFHALPGAAEPRAAALLMALCASVSPFPVEVRGLRFLGHGVAYALSAEPAVAIRGRIAEAFAGDLTSQDSRKWSPHVTVQNKVTPELARETMAVLTGQAVPRPITATGLALWRYRGGPWETVTSARFDGPA